MNKLIEDIHQDSVKKGNWDEPTAIWKMVSDLNTRIKDAKTARDSGNMADPVSYENYLDLGDFQRVYDKCIGDTFEDNLAQAAIELFDMSRGLGVNLEYYIEQRMKYNKIIK